MAKLRVAVLFGGCSVEYEVSLESASSVIRNLDPEKYDLILVGITKDGKWYRYDGRVEEIESGRWLESGRCVKAFLSPDRENPGLVVLRDGRYEIQPVDVVFPVLHGANGEDGSMQGLLQMAGLPYVGSDVVSSAVCMDKTAAHDIAALAGIPVPQAFVIHRGEPMEAALAGCEKLGYPVYVKPAKSGSSLGISKVYDEAHLAAAVEEAFRHDRKVLIEKNVEGFEVGCAVLGNEELVIGEVDEIEIPGGFFNYVEKYNLVTSSIHVPARVPQEKRDEIRAQALRLYRLLGCRGMARVDQFLTPAGEIVFNEINTIPGFTAHSRYPSMLGAIGISYPQMLDRVIALALEA